jgi:hypothetical protein
MSAPAAARGLFAIPVVKTACLQADEARALSVGSLLRQSGYTVVQLSTHTSQRYGSGSPYFIPPTFLYKLRTGITPHVCQVVALSESTGHRFVDWMRILGFNLHQIPRLQARLHPERTVLITPIGFETTSFEPADCTVGEWAAPPLARTEPCYADAPYLYVKVGRRDAAVVPQLVSGAIVRVDGRYRRRMGGTEGAFSQNHLWLVEHSEGLTCSQVEWIDDRQIVLLPSRPPGGSLPLCLRREARILGLVDWPRGSLKPETPGPMSVPVKLEPSFPPGFGRAGMRFSDLLRNARYRTGLTFRAAQVLTGGIARILSNRDYEIGLGLLSDYEAMGRLPRHIAKIISLCITYCVDIRQLLEAAAVYVDDSNKMPLPALYSSTVSEPDPVACTEHYRTIGLGASYIPPARWPLQRISRI